MSEHSIASLPVEEVLNRLGTSSVGLSDTEAQERLLRHGANSIAVVVSFDLWKLVRDNFTHMMAILLWVGGLVAFVAQMPQIGIAIWLVNILNGSFSLWQEFRAERATEALKRMLPTMVNVRRNDQQVTIAAESLVPGDILLVSEGDKISADVRLLSANELLVDQSSLTGESTPVGKDESGHVPSIDQSWLPSTTNFECKNVLFAGTQVVSGNGIGVVYATGISSEFGKIAHLTQSIPEQPSPLQKEMVRVTRVISGLAFVIGLIMFLLASTLKGVTIAQAFIFAMGMIVAFVPEGMVPTITLSLAMAVQRMARRKALVKKLSSVETLGCTNVICTDKTGTITENRMSLTHCWTFDGELIVDDRLGTPCGIRVISQESPTIQELLTAGRACNNATLKSNSEYSGDPTDVAILQASKRLLHSAVFDDGSFKRIKEHSFDSRRKRMSTVHRVNSGNVLYCKGAPESVIANCKSVKTDSGIKELEDKDKENVLETVVSYARNGLRVIAVAYKNLPDSIDDDQFYESCMTLLGLVIMLDPPRPEVSDAVARCKAAGIQICMMTGDHETTAEAIARQVGIIDSRQATKIFTGHQLDHMSDAELMEVTCSNLIFARINPDQKLRIVRAFQRCGKIVAVTGDGVNDGPALKQADIGVAMGLAGTDVARESADMILLDDNFASIVSAIEEGRAVYENIKKFATYVFNSNMAEAVPFFVMLFSAGAIPLPLTVMQVLAIDLGTDMLPAIGLGADPIEPGTISRPPRKQSAPLLSPALLTKALLWYGLIESVAGMSGFFYANWLSHQHAFAFAPMGSEAWKVATTMTMACIVFGQVGAVFCCRTQTRSIFSANPFSNRLVVIGVICELVLLVALVYAPWLQGIFDTAPLTMEQLAFAAVWTPIMICADEIRKWIKRDLVRRKTAIEQAKVLPIHQA